MMSELVSYDFGGFLSLHKLAAVLCIIFFTVGLTFDINERGTISFFVFFDFFVIVVSVLFLSLVSRVYIVDSGKLIISRFGKIKKDINVEDIDTIYRFGSGTSYLVSKNQDFVLYLERDFSPQQYLEFIEVFESKLPVIKCSKTKNIELGFKSFFL